MPNIPKACITAGTPDEFIVSIKHTPVK